MSLKMPSVHPLRLVASLLLAGAIAYSSYHILKPQVFSYVMVKNGTVIEGGSTLQLDQLEEAMIKSGDFFRKTTIPIPGLIPWSEVKSIVGMPVTRLVHGGEPLLLGDINYEGQLEQQLSASKTGMTLPIDEVDGVPSQLSVGDKVHIYASFEDDQGAHSGLLLKAIPIIFVQHEEEAAALAVTSVTVALTVDEAVMLTHALHYGKIRLGKAALADQSASGVGDLSFAKALMKTKKRWEFEEER